MGLPSGVFSSVNSGRLQIAFGGLYQCAYVGGHNTDFPGSGQPSVLIRCVADNGTHRESQLIDFLGASALIEFDYVAGENVGVSMTVVSYAYGGFGAVGVINLRIGCTLIKR